MLMKQCLLGVEQNSDTWKEGKNQFFPGTFPIFLFRMRALFFFFFLLIFVAVLLYWVKYHFYYFRSDSELLETLLNGVMREDQYCVQVWDFLLVFF